MLKYSVNLRRFKQLGIKICNNMSLNSVEGSIKITKLLKSLK